MNASLPIALCAALVLVLSGPGRMGAETRVALCVGNAAYSPPTSRLGNPVNDATRLEDRLRAAGFRTFLAQDQGIAGMTTALERFYQAARGADVALFFYAGHGVESEERNYLLPVDAALDLDEGLTGDDLAAAKRAALKREAIALDDILREMGNTRARLKLVVLDCCRNDPLPSRSWLSRDGAGGTFAAVKESALAEGTMLVFSTSPGKRAGDGAGAPNSPFTTALLESLQPGASILQVFTTTAGRVRGQEPWIKFDGSGKAMHGFGSLALVPAGPQAPAPAVPMPAVPGIPALPAVPSPTATLDRPHVNSLGMRFVPVPGTKVPFRAGKRRDGAGWPRKGGNPPRTSPGLTPASSTPRQTCAERHPE